MSNNTWTRPMELNLINCVKRGLTAAKIAQLFNEYEGYGVYHLDARMTRNSVLGKIYRLRKQGRMK